MKVLMQLQFSAMDTYLSILAQQKEIYYMCILRFCAAKKINWVFTAKNIYYVCAAKSYKTILMIVILKRRSYLKYRPIFNDL